MEFSLEELKVLHAALDTHQEALADARHYPDESNPNWDAERRAELGVTVSLYVRVTRELNRLGYTPEGE